MKRNTRRGQQDRGESEQRTEIGEKRSSTASRTAPLFSHSTQPQHRRQPRSTAILSSCTGCRPSPVAGGCRRLDSLGRCSSLQPRFVRGDPAPHSSRLFSAALLSFARLRAQRHGRVAPEQLDSTRPRWQPHRSGRQAGPHGRFARAGTRVGAQAHTRPYADV